MEEKFKKLELEMYTVMYKVLLNKLEVEQWEVSDSEIFRVFYKIGVEKCDLRKFMRKGKGRVGGYAWNDFMKSVSRMEGLEKKVVSLSQGGDRKNGMKIDSVLVPDVVVEDDVRIKRYVADKRFLQKVEKTLKVKEVEMFRRLESSLLRVLVKQVGIRTSGELDIMEVLYKIKAIAETWDLVALLRKSEVLELVSKMGKIDKT